MSENLHIGTIRENLKYTAYYDPKFRPHRIDGPAITYHVADWGFQPGDVEWCIHGDTYPNKEAWEEGLLAHGYMPEGKPVELEL